MQYDIFMSQLIRKFTNGIYYITHWRRSARPLSRKDLELKVTQGTEKAIKEYRKTFEILEEYDRH